ncbi:MULTISPECIES: phage structural protein [unclassified Shinella]|uniref:phage structural protein n=1 Tax=unclassified Shinella TaxID=2643062 RepID=UPI00234F8A5B|nr:MULTISPECIES: phage protein [unclassified Shinella]MCO5152584.1 DUF3277 family protein [Shinella sp.]MDC7261879.1 DUF3277 family protein [Shinella sp. HY16]MDC7268774.1 DUF3277 family protein [Shinella sp. YZ44]
MAKSTAYSYGNVAATLDRRAVQGVWDGDDAIVVNRGADVGSRVVGADGSSIFSITMDRSATITIRLQPSSPTHRLLLEKEKAQRALGASFPGFPFVIKDKVSGEGGTGTDCFIQSAPTDSKGKNATVREWVLSTGEWTPEITNG